MSMRAWSRRAILVILIGLSILYYGSRMFKDFKQLGSSTYHVTELNNLRSQAYRENVSTLWKDITLKDAVTKLNHHFKGYPFKEFAQRFIRSYVYLMKARQNKTLWRQLDLMSMPQFPFDPEFRNPCWRTSPMIADSDYFPAAKYTNGRKRFHKKPFLRCLPYFYLIGQGKSGTTDLFIHLIKHPDMAFMNRKETQWINRHRVEPECSCSSFDSYISMFQTGADDIIKRHKPGRINPLVTGEGTPNYFSDNDYWDRLPGNEGCTEPSVTNADIIHHITPGAKIILILRNPVDRLYSYYHFKHHMFNVSTSREHFHHLVLREIRKFQKCLESQSLRGCCYNNTLSNSLTAEVDLRRGIYHVFLSDWLKVFPREKIQIVKFEDYAANRTGMLMDIFKFLKLRAIPEDVLAEKLRDHPVNRRNRRQRAMGDMWNSTRHILNQFYRPYNKRLAYLLNDDKFIW